MNIPNTSARDWTYRASAVGCALLMLAGLISF